MKDLRHILFKMPDGWGKVYYPALHPSSCRPPVDPRTFMFATRLGWVKPSFSEALGIGDIFHDYMERYYTDRSIHQDTLLQQVLLAGEDALVERQEELAAAGEEPPSGDSVRKSIGVGAMLGQVFTELFPLKDNEKVVAVEQAFRMPLHRVHRSLVGDLVGKVDAVIYLEDKDEYWLVDHKSTSEEPDVRARGLTFDAQARLYRELWDAAHPDQPLTGVIHNIITKPSIRVKKNESFEDYIQRCFEWYDDKALTGSTKVRQSWVRFATRTSRIHEALSRELIEMLSRTAPWYTSHLSLSRFYRSGNHYDYVGFGRLTPYMDLLEMDPRSWYDYLVTHGFQKVHPDERYDIEETNND